MTEQDGLLVSGSGWVWLCSWPAFLFWVLSIWSHPQVSSWPNWLQVLLEPLILVRSDLSQGCGNSHRGNSHRGKSHRPMLLFPVFRNRLPTHPTPGHCILLPNSSVALAPSSPGREKVMWFRQVPPAAWCSRVRPWNCLEAAMGIT